MLVNSTPNTRFLKFLFKVAVIATLIVAQVPVVVTVILSTPFVLWILNYLFYSFCKVTWNYLRVDIEAAGAGTRNTWLEGINLSEQYL
jgi:hypothetical protein